MEAATRKQASKNATAQEYIEVHGPNTDRIVGRANHAQPTTRRRCMRLLLLRVNAERGTDLEGSSRLN
ncbi:hypothetical protein Trydic_g19227 [Trypoxylus dichotomus]